MSKTPNRTAAGVAVTAVGLITAITPPWAFTNGVSATATVALGLTAALHGGWPLIGPGPTEHWHLTLPALALAASPWITGFGGVAAACVAWISSIVLFLLADAAYAADEARGDAPRRRTDARARRRDGATEKTTLATTRTEALPI